MGGGGVNDGGGVKGIAASIRLVMPDDCIFARVVECVVRRNVGMDRWQSRWMRFQQIQNYPMRCLSTIRFIAKKKLQVIVAENNGETRTNQTSRHKKSGKH